MFMYSLVTSTVYPTLATAIKSMCTKCKCRDLVLQALYFASDFVGLSELQRAANNTSSVQCGKVARVLQTHYLFSSLFHLFESSLC